MPNLPTPNMGLIVPTVGDDTNNWGTELNSDLGVIDGLGIIPEIDISVNTNFAVTPYPWTVARVTTGNVNVTAVLPTAASCKGKVFTMKKIDAGTGTAILSGVASGSGSIDGQTLYNCSAQYQYVSVRSNGVNYDIVGQN